MTYSELGYLRLVYEVLTHESAPKEDKAVVSGVWEQACARLALDPGTAEIICEALEAR